LFERCHERANLEKKDTKGLGALLWRALSSLKLTIALLILLAAASVLGTVILQHGTPEQYLAEYGPNLSRILNVFGLFDMYGSWWFRALLGLLVLNVVFCSTERLPLVWPQIFHPRIDLSASRVQALPFTRTFRVSREKGSPAGEIEETIRRSFGRPVRHETSEGLLLFFERGRYGRLGVYIAHLSLILILLGGMIGSIFGFKGVVRILEGETVDRVFLNQNGRSTPYPLGYQVRCDDFEISFYDTPGPEKFVNEYTSTLSILEDGQEVRRETVRVNHPMTYRGIKFYQSSYGQEAEVLLQVRERGREGAQELWLGRGERIGVPGHDMTLQLMGYYPEVHDFGEGVQLLLFPKDERPRRIWLFRQMPDYDERRGGAFVFTLKDILLKDFTVLQVSREPAIGVVWVGCGLLIVGIFVAFFVGHRRLWVRMSKEGERPIRVFLGGTVHRNKVGFEREFGDIVRRLEEIGLKAI
jgi:cytochrome c biogenesis protein